jgi:hypothetical protein
MAKIARVQLPDGRIARIEVPDDTTPEQAQALALELAPKGEPAKENPTGTTDALAAKIAPTWAGRLIQGARDPVDAGAQLLPRGLEAITSGFYLAPNPVSKFFGSEAKRVDAINAKNEQDYQKARGEDAGTFDAWRLAGNVVSPANLAPAAFLSKPAMTAKALASTGAKAGAIGGALTPINELKEDQSFAATKLAQIGIGTSTGAVLSPVLAKAAGAAARVLERKLTDPTIIGARASLETDKAIEVALNDAGVNLADLPPNTMKQIRQQVLSSFKQGERMDPAALLRKQDFDLLGMKGPQLGPTQGQLTRSPLQFAKEKNLRAVPDVGDPLLARFYNQNRALGDKFVRMGAGDAMEAYPAGQMAVKSLEEVDDTLRHGVTAAYKAASESSGKDAAVSLTGLAQDYADVLNRFGDKVPSGVRNGFESLGVMGDIAVGHHGKIKISGNQTKVFSVEDADKLIKVINDNVSNDPATNKALGELRGAVKRAVLEQGDDVFAEGRKLAAKRFSIMELVPALKQASEGSIAADDFVRKFVINGKAEQLKAMAGLLDGDAKNQMRAQIVASLRRAAFGENMAGDKSFSPERYAQHLRSIGSEKMSAFFSEGEIETLRRMGRVGAYMNSAPAQSPVLGNPNMFWAGPMMGALDRIPMLGTAARMASGAAAGGRQAMDVNAALAGRVQPTPYVPPNLEPLLPYLGTAGGLGGGLLGGGLLR